MRQPPKPGPKSRNPPSRLPPARRASTGPNWTIVVGAAVVIAFIIGGLFAVSRLSGGGAATAPEAPVSDTVLKDLSGIPWSEANQIGQGTAQNHWIAVRSTPLRGPSGRPEVLYIGAEFCPYCAAERWALVITLDRFGSLSGLKTTTSASDDVFPSTPTFSFLGATYSSQFIDFSSVELTTNQKVNGRYAPLQTPTAQQTQILNQLDAPPYVPADSAGSIPFVSAANQYILTGASYDPGLLDNKTWDAIAASLSDPSTDLAKSIIGGANLDTAAVCLATGDQPGDVCGQAAIKNFEAGLAKQAVPK